MNTPEPEYYEIHDFELGKCAMCQRELAIGGIILVHMALCHECERMIKLYEGELGN